MLLSDQHDPTQLAEEIKNTLLSIADKCKLKKSRPPGKNDSPPWFNKECIVTKNNIKNLCNQLKKHPGDITIRTELFKLKRDLKKLIRKNKRQYELSIINKMTDSKETKNQKMFWKLFNKLDKNKHNKMFASPGALTKHFRTTLTSKRHLSIPPDSNENGKLDHHFTLEEPKKATSILKKGKATGMDNLSNEMLACCVENYPLLVIKLFNNILDSNKSIPD